MADNQQHVQQSKDSIKVYKRPKDDVSDDDEVNNQPPSSTYTQPDNESKQEANELVIEEEKKDESATANAKKPQAFPVQVFVRMRPLVGSEVSDNHEAVSYGVKKLKKSKTTSLTLEKVYGRNNERDKKYSGFRGVVLPQHDNVETFRVCLLPSVESVFAGEDICVFAYGHTGSGKTHTIFGYEKENTPGMFQLFARQLFGDERVKKADDIFVEIRFAELYQGKVRDLLSADLAECFVREDANGEIKFRANPTHCDDDGKIRAYPITSKRVQSEQELLTVIRDGIGLRNVGHSTLHDKSSRSHAFLEYEIVSNELLKVRNELIEKEADLLKHELMIDTWMYAWKLKKTQKTKPDPEVQRRLDLVEGLEIDDIDEMKEEMKTMRKEEEAIKLELHRLTHDEKRPFVGGTMVFVDLAGNEYGRDVKNKDKQEERERNEINKSLLALKECIRALHSNKEYVGYRGSKLTMYLRKYLNGSGSKAIMITNIGSSKNYAKQTINTLQYSQLVAKA